MAVKGVFTSVSGMTGDNRGDFASALLQYYPTGSAQLLALSSGMKRDRAADTTITWFEEDHLSGRTTITNAALLTTTFTVADASFIQPGMFFLVETTGELVYVSAVVGNDLTVTRGFASTTPTSVDGSGTPVGLQKIGSAFEESSDRPGAVAQIGSPKTNYTQIFRNTWNVSRTAGAIDYYTGNKTAKSKSEAGMFHSEDIERALWFGKKSVGTLNGKPFRTMDGVTSMIQTNVTVGAADIKWSDFNSFLQTVFETNIKGEPNERIAFCGNNVLSVINTLAQVHSNVQIMPGSTETGLKVNKWMTPFGDISLMTHPLFNENPVWQNDLHVMHPASVTMKYITDAMHDDEDGDGKRNGVDGDSGVVTSELSLKFEGEKAAGSFTNILAADEVNL